MSDDSSVSREMTRIICTVPGVVDVFPSRSLVRSIADNLVDGARGTSAGAGAGDATVVVSRAADGVVTATATIGVDAGLPTPDTLRAVGDELRRQLATVFPQGGDPIVNVNVSHITSPAGH